MRVKVVRTPGELRDDIGHKVLVQKDWRGTVVEELDDDALLAAGFHPMRREKVFCVIFDKWPQSIAVPAVNLVELSPDDEVEIAFEDEEDADDE